MTEESLLSGVEAEQEEKSIDQIEEDEYNSSQEENESKDSAQRPEGLDDSFWDDETKSIKQDDLINAYKKEQEKALGLRRKLSEKGSDKAPKKSSEYVLEESLNDLLPSDSATTNLLKEKALEAGLSKDKFNDFMSRVMPALKESGMIADAPLSEEEQKIQFEEYKNAELAKLGKEGPKVLQKLANWGDSMVNLGALSKDELPVFNNMITDATSMVVLNKIMSLSTGEESIPVKTAVVGGLPSRAEIDEIIASPEYDNGNTEAHKKVKAYFEAIS